ncbi:hypothetical protein [Leptolyngbya sp. GB1-A1]|uniref:hypothetical protein n=1 Tax=unclassified Leptolyngbya TaxID=2650499 RepID=UPI003299E67C
MNLARFGALMSAAAIVVSAAAPAMANIPAFFRDAENNVYFTGLSPQAQMSLTYDGMLRSRDYKANACGALVLRNSPSSPISGTIKVGGVDVNTSTLPVQLLPDCLPSGQFQEARPANFKTASGDVVIVGRTPGSYTEIQTPQDRNRNATANACGIARFTNSTSYQHTAATMIQFIFDGQPQAAQPISNLDALQPPLCSRGNLYVPASWLSGS